MDADRDRRVCADVRGWDGIRVEEVPSVDGHHLDRRRLFPGARMLQLIPILTIITTQLKFCVFVWAGVIG